MIVKQAAAENAVHNEDISLTGENIIGQPCTVWSITIAHDGASNGVVTITDSTTYSASSRVLKVAVLAHDTKHLPFPSGMPFSNGLSAISNLGTVDISVTYD